MKKLVIFLSALCLSAMAMAAARTVTFDFSDSSNPWSLPTDYVIGENTYTNETLSVKINGVGDGKGGGGMKAQKVGSKIAGLIMGKKGAYLSLPALGFDAGTIKVYGLEGGSGSVTFNVYVGETAVSTEVTSCKVMQTFKIADAYKTAGTVYTIKVTNANNIQISKIEVVEAIAGMPEEPVFSPKGGTYTSAQDVILSCATDGATIKYSYDGATYMTYSTALQVDHTQTIYAKAVKNSIESDVVSAVYTIVSTEGKGTKDAPYTVEDVAKLGNPGDAAWVTGYILGCSDDGGKLALADTIKSNILLGQNAEDSIGVPVYLSKKAEKEALNVVDNPSNKGRKAKIYGQLVSYKSACGIKNVEEYEVMKPAGTPDNPIFSLAEGTYTSAQTVTISCATVGASISYSFDKISFTPYSGAITVSETMTIYAVAEKSSLKSDVVKATYTIYIPKGDGTKENPYTIADVIAFNNPVDSTCAWVGGYIIGCGNSSGNLITDTAKLVDSNVLLADDAAEEKGCPVQLSKNVQKEIVGVKTNPGNVGEYLLVYGQLTSYLGKCGVKNVMQLDLNGRTDIKEVKNAECSMQHVEKRMENGRLVIERNGEKFSALGTKL